MVALQTSCSWVFSFASLFSLSDGVPRQTLPTGCGGRMWAASRLTHTEWFLRGAWSQRALRQCLADLWRKSRFYLLCPVNSPQLGRSGFCGTLDFQLEGTEIKNSGACSVPALCSGLGVHELVQPSCPPRRMCQLTPIYWREKLTLFTWSVAEMGPGPGSQTPEPMEGSKPSWHVACHLKALDVLQSYHLLDWGHEQES